MKKLHLIILSIFFGSITAISQNNGREIHWVNEPIKIMMNTHNANIKSFPDKSFYKSRTDWQHIIDSTWGPGLPLAQKQNIFNTYVSKLDEEFDGLQSLRHSWASWDSLKNFYFSRIDSSTSRGSFSAIISYFCSRMNDGHTYAYDDVVVNSQLNPGVPLLCISGFLNAAHIGAVTTCLPDSSVLVLRVVDNHPLDLEPGDIILGYNGVHWKDLVVELLEAELPTLAYWGGSNSSFVNNLFTSAGMNWHLFDTIDVFKYSVNDTLHLPVTPLINLNLSPILNNEQMEIPNIPFPTYFNDQVVTYGILNNSNIGYIYVFSEWPIAPAEEQFNQAVANLQNTDALIIDMRFNDGGYAFWEEAFNILSNETIYTINDAMRCTPSDFTLCPAQNQEINKITGFAPTKYDRPIAVLLGPTCVSMGDANANRLKYLYNVRTFGKPTWQVLGLLNLLKQFRIGLFFIQFLICIT